MHNALIIRLVLGARPNKGPQHRTITRYLRIEVEVLHVYTCRPNKGPQHANNTRYLGTVTEVQVQEQLTAF